MNKELKVGDRVKYTALSGIWLRYRVNELYDDANQKMAVIQQIGNNDLLTVNVDSITKVKV